MKNLLNRLLKSALYLVLLVLGVLIGKFYDIAYFEISRSIDLVNLLSIVVTIGLAIIITVHFDKRKSDNRIEKDLILILKRLHPLKELIHH